MLKEHEIILGFQEYEKKIADIEAKLAECEKKYTELFCRNIELETLYSQKTALLNFYKDTDLVKENQQLKQQLEETEEERDGNYENYSICWKDNEYLNQQLAEKEKEIEQLKSENHALMSDNAYQEADIFELIQNPAIQNQDKISFAVEQIIKTKETLIKFLQNDGFYENEWYDLFDEIDNQFKQLKEKNNATRKN